MMTTFCKCKSGRVSPAKLFFLILQVCFLAVAGQASANDQDDRWAALKPAYFAERSIAEGESVISMEAPKRAHDAAVVPIVIKSEDSALAIKQIHIIVDKNPIPLAGIFKFSDKRSEWESFETRIRINEYTNVRAIAELDDGSLHMTHRFVKAAGGCSAPAMADHQAALARAGTMRIILDEINTADSNASSKIANSEATIKISHPNNSGMQFDQISRNYIPAFYIHSIVAELNGEELLDIETNFSMSENPVIRFQFANASDAADFSVRAVDSKNNNYLQQIGKESQN